MVAKFSQANKRIEEGAIMDRKLKSELIIAVIAVVIVACIGVGLYFFYSPKSSTTATTTTTKSTSKSVIKDTSDPDIKKVTAPKSDSVDVKTSTGVTVSVPVISLPK
jgi:flagellar basal body-associated protein FliL